MSRAKLLLLSLVAVLSVAGVSASTASAKISFEWFVGGSLLKENETRSFDVNNDGKTFDFHSKLLGINVLLLSTEVSVLSGATIIGGRPGTNEETVLFKGVTVDPPLQKCVVEAGGIPNPIAGTVQTNPLKTEIVEGENGEVLILFSPKVGANFVELLFLDKGTEECAANKALAAVTGSILALPLPQRTEELRQNLVFEAAEKNFFLASGALDTVGGLRFGSETATITGLVLVLLANGAVFGPF